MFKRNNGLFVKRLRADKRRLNHWRITVALGYRHPDHLMAGMTVRQLRELELFYNIEPFGEYRDELRHGSLMALTANINRDEKLKAEPFDVMEFMHFIEEPVERTLSAEEIDARLDKILGC